MKVDVYVNLNRDCVSVRSRESEDYGTVVAHEPKVHLRDVEFVVQEAGRQKVVEQGVKNVHAFVRGEWDEKRNVVDGIYVTYDPFEYEQFYSPDVQSYVVSADRCAVSTAGVFATGVETVK